MGVDPSKGTGQHDGCIQIIKIDSIKPIKLTQVAVFRDSKTDPYKFSQLLNRLSIWYNNGLMMVENNGEGSAVIQHIWYTFENQNLYNTSNNNAGLGVRSNNNTKTKAVLLMKKLLEEKQLFINDYDTYKQLATFIEAASGNKFYGQDKAADDLVAALWWACYSLDLDIWDEDVNIIDINNTDDEAWGILSDIDDYTEETW